MIKSTRMSKTNNFTLSLNDKRKLFRNFFWYFTVVSMKYQWGPVMVSRKFSFWTIDLFFLYLNMLISLKEIHTCAQLSGFFIQLTEGCLETSWISTMELFCKNSERFLVVNYFRKKSFIVDVRLGSKCVGKTAERENGLKSWKQLRTRLLLRNLLLVMWKIFEFLNYF